MSTSLARLTSLSTQTLTLLLERQRLYSISTQSNALNLNLGGTEPSPQIRRNLTQLHDGILELESSSGKTENTKELRSQYERLRAMLGSYQEKFRSLEESEPERESTPPLDDYIPYKDEPSSSREPPTPGPDPPYLDGENYQMQQQMMNDQDERLDTLSASINRQRDLSLQINDELDVHTGLLESLDVELDRTEGRLSGARRKLERFSKGVKGNVGTFVIAFLIAALLILIVIFKT